MSEPAVRLLALCHQAENLPFPWTEPAERLCQVGPVDEAGHEAGTVTSIEAVTEAVRVFPRLGLPDRAWRAGHH